MRIREQACSVVDVMAQMCTAVLALARALASRAVIAAITVVDSATTIADTCRLNSGTGTNH